MDFDKITWDMAGKQIEAESFRRIETEFSPVSGRWTLQEWRVARRLIHTTADFSIVDTLQFRNAPIEAGIRAMRRGVPFYVDSNMIKAGLSVAKLQQFSRAYNRDSIHCYVADADVAETAARENITRALAGVRKARPLIDGGIFLCGNAPLALAGVVKMCVETNIRPALIIGMPVGFVNVVESKELLGQLDIPHITIEGRRGGSPLAVAAMHAIMESGADYA
jgi:precorrin isomerase